MTIEERQKEAAKAHASGCNCAQSIAFALRDLVADKIDVDTLYRITEGFGLGMGGMEGTCGALSGAVAVIGLANSGGSGGQPTKASTYPLSRALLQKFAAQNGSVRCKDLKGVETGHVLRSCPDCISDAVAMACEILHCGDTATAQKPLHTDK